MADVKKVEIVTKSGKIIKVMPHMLNDLAKFDATPKRPVIKPAPKELIGIPPGAKPSILPNMEKTVVPPDLTLKKTAVKPRTTKAKTVKK